MMRLPPATDPPQAGDNSTAERRPPRAYPKPQIHERALGADLTPSSELDRTVGITFTQIRFSFLD
jgi:hypothetical protein